MIITILCSAYMRTMRTKSNKTSTLKDSNYQINNHFKTLQVFKYLNM